MRRLTGCIGLVLCVVLILGFLEITPVSAEPVSVEKTTEVVEEIVVIDTEPLYFIEGIELSEELQEVLYNACEEFGVPYELAVSMVWKESRFHNSVGDSGNSLGYMQIQPRWHQDKMEALGVYDLMDPSGNFRVGCMILSQLLSQYSVEDALSVYNTGSPGSREYSSAVLDYMEGLI